ncbi:MAG: universal stress protein [Verrucomicrobiae bacterium]|nr:universal stress protein [Verrucomicrobiae bacterium]NNJ43010.1 universal stress protein [Akkermansiaceae bacterium]
MKPIPPIIAGIDFSASSSMVLRHAAHAGALHGAPVIAVHVLSDQLITHWTESGGAAQGIESLESEARERLQKRVADVTPDADVRIEVCRGRPSVELSRIVEQHDSRLLVIAANDMTKKHLGLIASRCVRTIPCDVLILRDWQRDDCSKIVVGTNFSLTSDKVVQRGIELATAYGAELEIVHVIYPPDQNIWGETLDHDENSPLSYAEECRAKAKEKMARSLDAYAPQLADIHSSSVILESEVPSLALTYHIQDSGADLAVLGTRVHSKLAGYFMGTNAERLMRDATVSVLAVRV